VVAEVDETVAVVYGGRIVESGDLADVYDAPGHPYTQTLLEAIPSTDVKEERLRSIEGSPPPAGSLIPAVLSILGAHWPRTSAGIYHHPMWSSSATTLPAAISRARSTNMPENQLLEAREVVKHFAVRGRAGGGKAFLRALDGVSFWLARGETRGSSANPDAARQRWPTLVMLETPTSGEVTIDGHDITSLRGKRLAPFDTEPTGHRPHPASPRWLTPEFRS
jgi:peptide/nickel transport system ATP-binding protein